MRVVVIGGAERLHQRWERTGRGLGSFSGEWGVLGGRRGVAMGCTAPPATSESRERERVVRAGDGGRIGGAREREGGIVRVLFAKQSVRFRRVTDMSLDV